jgi:hypothetical protein
VRIKPRNDANKQGIVTEVIADDESPVEYEVCFGACVQRSHTCDFACQG